MIQVYEIKGMHCHSCIAKIKSALTPIAANIEVTLSPPRAKLISEKIIPVTELNGLLATVGNYQFAPISEDKNMDTAKPCWLRRYYPLILIFLYIFSVSLISQNKMHTFMAGFFLVFSGFKFLDLPGFAKAYATYDLLAKRWRAYGFIYPFLELILGFAYLTILQPVLITYLFTILLMGFSSLGVIQALAKKQKIQCACLGTVLNLPMTVITLAEDLAMVLMAVIMLCIHFT